MLGYVAIALAVVLGVVIYGTIFLLFRDEIKYGAYGDLGWPPRKK